MCVHVALLESVSTGDLDPALRPDSFQRDENAGVPVLPVVGPLGTGELGEGLALDLKQIKFGFGGTCYHLSREATPLDVERPLDAWSPRVAADDGQHLVDADPDLEVLAIQADVQKGHIERRGSVPGGVRAQPDQPVGRLRRGARRGQGENESDGDRDVLAHAREVSTPVADIPSEGLCPEKSYAQMMKRGCVGVLMLFAVIAAIGAMATPAWAHAAYKSSDPPDRGQVSSPPGEVTATFTEPLGGGSFLQITDPCGQRVDGGDVRIVGYDMSVSMSGSAQGRYAVDYRAHSTLDPHVTEGTFSFTVTSGETCAGEQESPDQDEPARERTDRGGDHTGSAHGAGSDPAVTTRSPRGPREQTSEGSSRSRSGGAGNGARPGRGESSRSLASDDDVQLAAEEDEAEAPSVWEGIRLEPFLTGLLLAAIIGAAGGKMYAGIMGPRA